MNLLFLLPLPFSKITLNKEGVHIAELKGGSRRGSLPGLRAQLAMDLVRDYGLTLAETARQLGVSTSAISKMFERSRKNRVSHTSRLRALPAVNIKAICS